MKEAIHINIKQLRGSLTQDEFAKMIGANRSNVGAWEEGRGKPNLEVIDRICDIYGISFKQLIGAEPYEKEEIFNARYSTAPENIRRAIDLLLVPQGTVSH
jgi:transcriptional regulator with XRE-family HTH domain